MRTESRPQALRRRAALTTMRSVLVALVLVALLGSLAAVLSYHADVDEALRQVRSRVEQQGQLYAQALSFHFDTIRTELQRLAERGADALAARTEPLATEIRGDAELFGGGVILFDLQGNLVWSEPSLSVEPVNTRPWFQAVLATGRPAMDEWMGDDSSRLAVALPVRMHGALKGLLVGIVRLSDRLLLNRESTEPKMLLLSSRQRVLLPLQEPAWSRGADFFARMDGLRTAPPGTEAIWTVPGDTLMAEVFPVPNTELHVVALESEEHAISPIRERLKVQLVFLLMVQLVALGAFVLFLRRTWSTFLDAEQQFANQEKMAALGTASSLIAHEVRNSLNALKAAAGLLDVGGDAKLISRTVHGQVERLAHLARSLLSFAKPNELKRVSVQLDLLTAETVQALSALPEWPEATVSLALESEVHLESDPLLLSTAIDNLARNAIEAVVASKDLGRTEHPAVKVSARRQGTDAVVIVEDNAGEAPAELETRLGEPFFTTKSKGIGLGLSMARKAVEQLGGTLSFRRTPRGSQFELRIPLHPQK